MSEAKKKGFEKNSGKLMEVLGYSRVRARQAKSVFLKKVEKHQAKSVFLFKNLSMSGFVSSNV